MPRHNHPNHNNHAQRRQSSRSAVTPQDTRDSRFRKDHARAAALEQQLSAMTKRSSSSNNKTTTNTDDVRVNQVRVTLCEVLCSLLLLDPQQAAEEQVMERLWNRCFYERLLPLRRKQQKRKEADVATTISVFQNFVSEGITLYAYLCDKLQAQLVDYYCASKTRKTSGSGDGGGMTADSDSEDDDDDATRTSSQATLDLSQPPSPLGILACLTRLYIHMGDLYRYANNFQKAQAAYQRSANLAPGHGNAYNQLGVVAHLQTDHVVVAVYYYIRAILATTDSFDTAKVNLMRLYEENCKILIKLQQDDDKQTLSLMQPSKTILSKRFLTEFVDLQYYWAKSSQQQQQPQQQQEHNNDDDDEATTLAETMQRTNSLMSLFGNLLQQSAFGEGLLIKLVCIQVYAEHAHPQYDHMVRYTTRRLAHTVAKQVSAMLDKLLAKNKNASGPPNGNKAPSIKLLVPLLLLTEYMYHYDPIVMGDDQEQECVDFWKNIVEIFNQLVELAKQLEWNVPDDKEATTTTTTNLPVLKDYQALSGFTPFEFMFAGQAQHQQQQRLENGYISDQQAMVLLKLTSEDEDVTVSSQATLLTAKTLESISHQSSSVVALSSSSNNHNGLLLVEEGRIKLLHFLQLGNKMVADGKEGMYVTRSNTGTFEWIGDSHRIEDDDDENVDMMMMMDSDNENANAPLLVYKEDSQAAGVPLLVPGMLLKQQSTNVASSTSPTPLPVRSSSSNNNNQEPKMDVDGPTIMRDSSPLLNILNNTPSLAPPPPPGMVVPPPGFGTSTSNASTLLGSVSLTERQAPALSIPTGVQQPAFFFESPLLFGNPSDYQTSNPFARPVHVPPPLHAQQQQQQQPPSFDWLQNQQASSEPFMMGDVFDSTTLLGAGLLSSILSDDSPQKSRNPFAAK
jgi:tetratricopeptide (TPR) repeat protein